MPDELVAIIIVLSIMTFVWTVIRSTQQYKLKKLERETGKAGDTLTTSELQEMIELTVSEATAPIREEVKSLAGRLDELEGTGGGLELPEEEGAPEKTVGRQLRDRQQ